MVHEVKIRECTPADAEVLALVGAATFLEAFAGTIPGEAVLAHTKEHHVTEAYLAAMRRPETRIWVAEAQPGGAPVGYAMLTAPEFPTGLAEEGDLELRRIYLFSRFHGLGAGQKMMEEAIECARDQGAKHLLLGVHPENWRALAFYHKHKFKEVGRRHFQVGTSTFEDPVLRRDL